MQSDTMSVQKLFQDRRQYRIPFFQRPYVWNKEDQWERLWSDISEKADIRFSGDQPPPHFLGAVVLEPQQRQGLLGVEMLDIIDGQQRLTTLQYVLSALAILLRKENEATLLSVVDTCLRNANTDTMQQPDIEIFKVWPTFRDRLDYQLAMAATSLDDLHERFPQSFTQSGTLKKIAIDHPPALEAIWYFADQIDQWISQDAGSRKPARLAAISEALLRDLQLVWIALGELDDAQVIFETLNGHGAELHATDLIRNFVFMRADREGAAGDELYMDLWSQFESGFWTEQQRRGRLLKPRIEWFIQTTLQAILGDEVEIGRLYANYRRFALARGRVIAATEQLRILDAHASSYRQLITGVGDDPVARFGRRTAVWDVSTAHALALRIASSTLLPETQTRMFDDLTSYFVRRAICGLTAKNYNKTFLQLIKKLAGAELTPAALHAALAGLEGETSRWPRDDEFRKAWLNEAVYPGRLDAARVKAVLAELETGMRSARSEEPLPARLENLDVDHVLPIAWFEYWPLPDGTRAQPSDVRSSLLALVSGEALSPKELVVQRREEAKATIGNLTLVHSSINRSLQNREFLVKREKFFQESNLHLNRSLMLIQSWDETQIAARGQALFDVAAQLWRGPRA